MIFIITWLAKLLFTTDHSGDRWSHELYLIAFSQSTGCLLSSEDVNLRPGSCHVSLLRANQMHFAIEPNIIRICCFIK